MRRLALLITAGIAVLIMRPASAVPLPDIDAATRNCTELVPNAVHVPVIDPDDVVYLDTFFVLDRGITEERALEVMAKAQEAYTPLAITLRHTGTLEVALNGVDSQSLIRQAQELFPNRERPAASDVVWVLTSVDISAPTAGSGVVGQADCIGGVRYDRWAFQVSELRGGDGFGFGPFWMVGNWEAKTVAHETGHLLGAHHHYANCAEGVPSESDGARPELSPCTLMFPEGTFISINFGALEAAVVRAHAEEYARP